MKLVTVSDNKGWLKAYWVKDTDADVRFGIPVNPPDINKLDWDEIKKEIHNQLVERNLTTWQDVQREQSAITSIVNSVVRNRIIQLYKIAESEVKDAK